MGRLEVLFGCKGPWFSLEVGYRAILGGGYQESWRGARAGGGEALGPGGTVQADLPSGYQRLYR